MTFVEWAYTVIIYDSVTFAGKGDQMKQNVQTTYLEILFRIDIEIVIIYVYIKYCCCNC